MKIASDELMALMGESNVAAALASQAADDRADGRPQGSGKTTSAAKLARYFVHQGRAPMLVAADVYRPAAAEQLAVLGQQVGVPVSPRGGPKDAVASRAAASRRRCRTGRDLIVDTAGRLTIDAEMMDELVRIKKAVNPTSVVLVVDAMTGQDGGRGGEGLRRGGRLRRRRPHEARRRRPWRRGPSVRAVSGKPILFVGIGEKLEALEPFHPDRMASRILGMGDVMSLIERAQENVTEDDAKKLEAKVRSGSPHLEDFLDQMQQVRKMGPMSQVLGMIPGFRNVAKAKDLQVDDGQLERVERSSGHDDPRAAQPGRINGEPPAAASPPASGTSACRSWVNHSCLQFNRAIADEADGRWGRIPALGGLLGLRPIPYRLQRSTVVQDPLAPGVGGNELHHRVVVADFARYRATVATSTRSAVTTPRPTPPRSTSTSRRPTPRSRTGAQPTPAVKKLIKIARAAQA